MKPSRLLLLILWLSAAITARAQEYLLQHYTRQDGLSDNNVFRIFQDSKGFIWLSTHGGLVRFDGQTFHHFGDFIANTPILSISETASSELLACSYSHGLFTLKDGKATRLRLLRDSLPSHTLYAFTSKSTTWFIAKSDYARLYRINDGRLRQIELSGNKQPVHFNKLIRNKDQLLIASTGGAFVADDTMVSRLFPGVINDEVTDVGIAANGHYWVAFKHSIAELRDGKLLNSFVVPGGKTINNLLIDKKGNVWASLTEEGILLVENGRLIDVSSRFPIDGTIVNDMFEDREGNIWLGTYTDGLYRLNTVAILSYDKRNSSLSIYCSAITRLDAERILLGSNGKINIWDNGTIRPFPTRLLQPGYFINFLNVENQKLYIGTPNGMIEKDLSPPFNERFVLSANSRDPVFGTLSFLRDSKGRTWIGGFTTLFQMKDGKLQRQTDPILSRRFNTIYEAPDGNILFGTDSGMIIFDGQQYKQIFLGTKKENNSINCFYTDQQKRLWATTMGGIVCIQNKSVKMINIGDGFLSNRCKDIVPINKDALLIATYNGLVQLDLNSLSLKSFATELNQSEILKLFMPDSSMIFAGNIQGMFMIRPGGFVNPPGSPQSYITTVKTTDTELYMPASVQLSYAKSRLRIEFAALDYSNSANINYRYRFEGSDENRWQYTSEHAIEIPALQPGKYVLLISARSGTENWGNPATLLINVATPLWQQPWFIALALIAGIAIVWRVSRHFILRMERKKRERLYVLNKITYLKQQALSAMMNPHFIFNCMNSIQHFMNKHENDLANSYLADFSSLIRMTLEDAQKSFISLDKEISRINLYLSLEQLRFGDRLHYSCSIDPALEPGQIMIPNMILQPYIENAIWHGIMPSDQPGTICLSFVQINDHQLVITVQDSGVGFKETIAQQSGKRQHWGIRLTKERLHLLQRLLHQYYDVTVKAAAETTGTIVTITVPLHPDPQLLHALERQTTSDTFLSNED